MMLTFPEKGLKGEARETALSEFADGLKEISDEIGMKVSARGWCYELESHGLTKADFDYIEGLINDCRRIGILPIDFTAEEEGRQFSGVEEPEDESPVEWVKNYVDAVLNCPNWYTPDWWKNEDYYIQMVVEKVDLKTLFEPVCQKFHIPIATAKGWSSMLMRATYSRRFAEAEDKGLKCVLLYCGDHDPDGLRIGKFLRDNIADLSCIQWADWTPGYDPEDLIIERFGLNADFIFKHNLTWIDNLITGSKRNLADPNHKNFRMDYVQEYLKKYGARKCEANALVRNPSAGRELCLQAILKYLGKDATQRFQIVKDEVVAEMREFQERTGLREAIERVQESIEDEE